MMTYVDDLLDRITMYRLVLLVLIGLITIATALSPFGLLPFTPQALLLSTGFLIIVCWITNLLLARIFAVPANIESPFITALILALIVDPPHSPGDLQLLAWVAVLAISSKYIFAINGKHLFNPAAIAVVLTSFALGESASWWVGTMGMLPAVLLGGGLLVRKLRQTEMVGIFLAAALGSVCLVSFLQGLSLTKEVQQLLGASPLFFFATIMLTEPLTAPPTQNLKRIYGLITGILFIPQIHLGPIYSTPELALVLANIYAYIVSPKQKVALKFRRKRKIASNVLDFVFKPSQRLQFEPGQYMEITLAHARPDSRGNRRFFTIASSPTEEALHLGVRFAARGSSFKKALYQIDGQANIIAAQVAGDFTLPQDARQKLVFIAGGVGITPFRSMLKYLLDLQQPRDIILLYTNSTSEEIAYQDILDEAQTKLGIKVFYTLTNLATIPYNWSGLIGRIDERMLRRAIPDYQERTYYISGPPAMVRATEEILCNMQVRKSHMKKDSFQGLGF